MLENKFNNLKSNDDVKIDILDILKKDFPVLDLNGEKTNVSFELFIFKNFVLVENL